MSIKVKHGEYEFELETESDLRIFLSATKNSAPAVTAPLAPPGGDTIMQKMRKLYERAKRRSNQKRFVQLLANEPEGLTDLDLRQRLSFPNNNVLGGVVANFRKNAYACGLTIEQVILTKDLKGSAAIRHYRLTPDMRDIVLTGQG